MMEPESLAQHLEQLAILSRRGVCVADILDGLVLILRRTHEAGPNGLQPVQQEEDEDR